LSSPTVFALRVGLTLVVLMSAFVMGVHVGQFLVCPRCPRAQPFVKVGARAPVPCGSGATARDGAITKCQERPNLAGGLVCV